MQHISIINVCHTCGKTFESKKDLSEHITLIHERKDNMKLTFLMKLKKCLGLGSMLLYYIDRCPV